MQDSSNFKISSLDSMRNLSFFVIFFCAATANAQTYRAPRTPDGKPNLGGVWQALNEAYWDIEGHAAAPGRVVALGAADAVTPGLGVVEGGAIPYLPEAAAKKKQNFENRLTLDPEIKCYLPGVPRATYMPQPFQIIQSAKHIMVIHQYATAVRTIYMDNQTEAPADSWMGWSNGRWEGETLVVDTTGFNDKTWFDNQGHPHTEQLHTVERYTRTNRGMLAIEIAIDDAGAYSRPFTLRTEANLMPDGELMEYICSENNQDLPYISGPALRGQ